MMMKRVGLAATLLVFRIMAVLAQGNEIMAQGDSVSDKFAWLQAFAQSNNRYILEVRSNESIGPHRLEYSGRNNITIILRGIGENRTVRTSTNDMFTVGSGVSLVLDGNITLLGGRTRLVSVSGGSLIMNDGSTINGGGVNLTGGTFTMNGGTISGIGWSAVDLHLGTFIMNGGTISGNAASHGRGGGVFFNGSAGGTTFTMNGGTISGNTANHEGGGVYVDNNGTFIMNGGTISGNTARGHGGGVYVTSRGTFTKIGGTITGFFQGQDNSNRVGGGSFRGHGVFVGSGRHDTTITTIKIKEGNSGPNDNLSYDGKANPPTYSGAWDN